MTTDNNQTETKDHYYVEVNPLFEAFKQILKMIICLVVLVLYGPLPALILAGGFVVWYVVDYFIHPVYEGVSVGEDNQE